MKVKGNNIMGFYIFENTNLLTVGGISSTANRRIPRKLADRKAVMMPQKK
jgi:hypothetical protein